MKVFVDTMIYLHFLPVEDIDWCSLLNADDVSLVVPRITVRELDRHKTSHPSSRVRDRARHYLARIEEWIQAGSEIRPRVRLEYVSTYPTIDFAQHGLNPSWADDILVASILQYAASHPSEPVVLVTEDSGPRLTAKSLGMSVFELPDGCRLQAEPDPLEIENRELSRTLARLRNALPVLSVGFAGEDLDRHFARFTLPAPPNHSEDEVNARLESVREELPKFVPDRGNSITGEPFGTLQQAIASMAIIPKAEYERYNNDVEAYVSRYRDYTYRTWDVEAMLRRTVRFQVEIQNTGSAPAEDVDIELHFPDGFQLLLEGQLPRPPEEPRVPAEPRSSLQMAMTPSIRIPDVHLPSPTALGVRAASSFRIKRTGSYSVTDHFTRIKHGTAVRLPELFLAFESYDTAKSFSCSYTLTLANLPDALKGGLDFVIDREVDD